MSMHSLQWVHGEILARMNEARLAVEAHAAEPENTDAIVRCRDLVHQIHRVLTMVGVHGPALLVEEMGALAQEIADESISSGVDAHVSLMRSLIDLTGYLDRLRSGWREHPLDLLQMVNDLRSARGQTLLSPGALLSPPLWTELPDSARGVRRRCPDFRGSVQRLRRLYQTALLALLRGSERSEYEYLQRVDEILERVEAICSGTPAVRLWWVARAMVQSLANADLELTAALKRMLGQLDLALKVLAEEGESHLQRRPPAELLRQLLYYVASSPAQSARTAEVKEVFELHGLLGSGNSDTSTGGHIAALSAVSVPLNAALNETEEKLSQVASPGADASWNQDISNHVRQLSVTLGLLGMNDLRTGLEQRAGEVSRACELDDEQRAVLFLKLAGDLIDARAIIGALNDPGSKGIPNAAEIAMLRYHEARLQGVAQIKMDLFVIKEQLTEFVSDSTNTEPLGAAALMLRRCLGVLSVIRSREVSPALSHWAERVQGMPAPEQAKISRGDLEQVAELIIAMESDLDLVDSPDTPEEPAVALVAPQPETAAIIEPAAGSPTVSTTPATGAWNPAPEQGHGAANPLGLNQEMDEELLGIFTDELAEVIELLNDHVPIWEADPGHREALLEIRRAFHTLKGSGRVVGATDVGDFAWSIESVLNRTIDGKARPSTDVARLVLEGTSLLPQVLESLRAQQTVRRSLGDVQARARKLVA